MRSVLFRLAPVRSAPERLAPRSTARWKLAPARLAPARLAPARLRRLRLTPARLQPGQSFVSPARNAAGSAGCAAQGGTAAPAHSAETKGTRAMIGGAARMAGNLGEKSWPAGGRHPA